MAELVRWNPMGVRRSLVNDMLDEMMRYTARPYQEMSWDLALDVAENENEFVIKASVPGVDPEQIDITIEDNTLSIKGSTESDSSVDEENYHLRERRYGQFMRSVTLPARISSDNVEAECENGVLTVRIPKAEEAKAKRIAVKGGSNGHKVIEADTK